MIPPSRFHRQAGSSRSSATPPAIPAPHSVRGRSPPLAAPAAFAYGSPARHSCHPATAPDPSCCPRHLRGNLRARPPGRSRLATGLARSSPHRPPAGAGAHSQFFPYGASAFIRTSE